VHVDDVIRAALSAVSRGRVGETYIITSERSYPVRELVSAIAGGLGVSRGCVTVPRWALYAAAAASQLRSTLVGTPPALTTLRLKSILADRSFDISKAVEDLGYAPRTSLRDGVMGTVEWYRGMGYL
jgi:nucleoside-diphosphate-sugar epimerase